MVTISTIREQVAQAGEGVSRVVTFTRQRPTLLGRIVSTLLALAIGLLAVILVVPFLLLALLVVAGVVLYVRLKLWLAGARAPNGPLDGRRNVRVRAGSQGTADT